MGRPVNILNLQAKPCVLGKDGVASPILARSTAHQPLEILSGLLGFRPVPSCVSTSKVCMTVLETKQGDAHLGRVLGKIGVCPPWL